MSLANLDGEHPISNSLTAGVSAMSLAVALPPSAVFEAFPNIQWGPADRIKISESEGSLIRAAEANPLDYTLAVQSDADAYIHTLLQILDQISVSNSSSGRVAKLALEEVLSHEEALQMMDTDELGVVLHYVISKLCDVIVNLKAASQKAQVTLASTFYPSGILIENWRPLLRVLHGGGSDAYAQRGASFCLSCILQEGCQLQEKSRLFSPVSSILESFVSWIISRMQGAAKKSLSIVTPSLMVLIVSKEARDSFDAAGGISYVSRHLRVKGEPSRGEVASVQQLYELAYCLWLMSYDCEANEKMRRHFYKDGGVTGLVDLVSAAPREKVVRVAVMTLQNLASCTGGSNTIDGPAFLKEMIGCGLPKSIALMKERKWNDPEIVEAVNELSDKLNATYQDMTRFDVYEYEVDSGHLQWGFVHSDKFFRENAKNLEGKDGKFAIVRTLVQLAAGQDEEVAAIACFDIGEFVRHYPGGKQVARRLGAREVVMHLIEHQHPELRQQALLCISKLLVDNWKAIG